jgi:hypothetical protein
MTCLVASSLNSYRIHEFRFGPYTARPRLSLGYLDRAIGHVSRGDGEEVRRDRYELVYHIRSLHDQSARATPLIVLVGHQLLSEVVGARKVLRGGRGTDGGHEHGQRGRNPARARTGDIRTLDRYQRTHIDDTD